ncbi:hypothetical protein CUT44_11130 [Streptomyces carminius]|uniref:Uncharacterized protein n=1 Tax=Streptomyces carminius TaxID=2665496 RepID=A0A2M8M0F7_9ACTN|nr:hypothetical protein [Streptomyces carminius]PJE97679.1 hypothetical protein CUT44_11130 [Streptomyces carminius]
MSRLRPSRHNQSSSQSRPPGGSGVPAPPAQPPLWNGPPPEYAPTRPARKRHRVFFWFFLAVQALFLVWIITGIAGNSGTPAGCAGLTGKELELCEGAGDVGTAIGVGLIIALWVAVDVILGLTYLVYRLARRQPAA